MRPVITISLFLALLYLCLFPAYGGSPEDEADGFKISGFDVIGNTLLMENELKKALKPYTGMNKTARDVEEARSALEKLYHEKGYPAVLVDIPEQTVEGESVQLKVIESKIRRVRITGNRYFTMKSILNKLPSFTTDAILYLPTIQNELQAVNSHPDIKVAPVLIPGKELGTIDVELKVKDKLPLHGSLELNNRSSHDTTDLRLNGLIRYDNLWQKEHSISFQYQSSPQDIEEVKAIALSYVLSAPWNDENILAIYSVWSDSSIAFGQQFQTLGKGFIVGARYVIPLPSVGHYTQNLTTGMDYKDFKDDLLFQSGEDAIETPLTYFPISLSYASGLNHFSGVTRLNLGLNLAFRGVITEKDEFEDKRYNSRGNYVYATLGIERQQILPKGYQLVVKCDGQIADQPLPSNEQYVAGGLKNVRGYKESEEAGDDGIHATVELSYPNLTAKMRFPESITISPNIFYDIAALRIKDALPGQEAPNTLSGTGAGLRGKISQYLEYEVSWGMALQDTKRIKSGDQQIYFVIKGQF